MAFRINNQGGQPFPKSKPVKRSDYGAFIRSLPCCVTGRRPVEGAHLSYAAPHFGHYGRGRGTKAPDRWMLPLCPEEHRRQHAGGEADYWYGVGLNPHVLALTLFGLWSDLGDEAEPFAVAIINQHLASRGNLPVRES